MDEQYFSLSQENIPDVFIEPIKKLNEAANTFLNTKYAEKDANAFCHECVMADIEILRNLVKRDGRVLRLTGEDVRPGPAFSGSHVLGTSDNAELNESEPTVADVVMWPDGISNRIRNLYLLNLDLYGELDTHLYPILANGDGQ